MKISRSFKSLHKAIVSRTRQTNRGKRQGTMGLPPALTKDEFLAKAKEFLVELQKASSFEEMVSLWRGTSIPYTLASKDPFSAEYKAEVLEIYEALTNSAYDVQNELTSDKQSEESFEIGYPWISGNLAIVADEMAKPLQILRALDRAKKSGVRIVEFGAGWGNLAFPLARARQEVIAVDIDQGFLDRIARKAKQENLNIRPVYGDFVETAASFNNDIDVAIFQSSFHHCLDFREMLITLREKTLTPNGIIIFGSEPISGEFGFPWGLRFDGESLWAIMCNKWLELGFDFTFFTNLMLRCGFLLSRIPAVPGYVGEGWQATQVENGLNFSEWALPSNYDSTFHALDGDIGRFCQSYSRLPRISGDAWSTYELTFVNYGTETLAVDIRSSEMNASFEIRSGQESVVQVKCQESDLAIKSDIFSPHKQQGNGDVRLLGVNLRRVRVI